jgi:hypothetical protein
MGEVFLSGTNGSKRVRMSKSNEDNAHHFPCMKDIVHFEFISEDQTVNQAYYVEILKRLHEALRRKRLELWSNDWILHHDSASARKVLPNSFWPKNPLLIICSCRNLHL